jgi:hypothetical protein
MITSNVFSSFIHPSVHHLAIVSLQPGPLAGFSPRSQDLFRLFLIKLLVRDIPLAVALGDFARGEASLRRTSASTTSSTELIGQRLDDL